MMLLLLVVVFGFNDGGDVDAAVVITDATLANIDAAGASGDVWWWW